MTLARRSTRAATVALAGLTRIGRIGRIGLVGLCGLLGVLGAASCSGEAERPLTVEERLEADDRIRPLLVPCDHGRQFTSDTSDMTRVLAGNLVFSELEPLRRSKAELAALGEEAVPDLRRVFDDNYADQFQHGVLENVLAVCALMEAPAGLEIVRDGLRHPHEGVRLAALDAIRKFGGPEDFELVLFNVSIAANEENQADFATTLHVLDPARFYLQLLEWVEADEYRQLWRYLAPPAADAEDPVVLAKYAELTGVPDPVTASDLPPSLRTFLVAALAANGNEVALASLREELSADQVADRDVALRAAERVGLLDEVRIVLEQDDNEALRARAAAILAEGGGDEVLEALRMGLSDPGVSVRTVCIQELIRRGDGGVRAQALEMLRGGVKERADAVRALRQYWEHGSEGISQALETLTTLFREQAEVDAASAIGLLQTLSQVPGRASAEFIMEVGKASEGEMRGWPAHRWCAFQVFNTGPEGLAYLRELHAQETDPIRRLDYLAAIWQDHSDEARETLRGVVLDERSTPYELLYAAGRLVRIGPAREQAPFLKRAVYFENTHEKVRPALQCLLWRWYGGN